MVAAQHGSDFSSVRFGEVITVVILIIAGIYPVYYNRRDGKKGKRLLETSTRRKYHLIKQRRCATRPHLILIFKKEIRTRLGERSKLLPR